MPGGRGTVQAGPWHLTPSGAQRGYERAHKLSVASHRAPAGRPARRRRS